jgi:hypothetical protein
MEEWLLFPPFIRINANIIAETNRMFSNQDWDYHDTIVWREAIDELTGWQKVII